MSEYLAPIACRKCLDPVCMIGCPVTAIVPGEKGEVKILGSCIGCSQCAEWCPYGSIQMTTLAAKPDARSDSADKVEPGYKKMNVKQRAVVCDLCASTTLGREACVYACPHDAAMRVNGFDHFRDRLR